MLIVWWDEHCNQFSIVLALPLLLDVRLDGTAQEWQTAEKWRKRNGDNDDNGVQPASNKRQQPHRMANKLQ